MVKLHAVKSNVRLELKDMIRCGFLDPPLFIFLYRNIGALGSTFCVLFVFYSHTPFLNIKKSTGWNSGRIESFYSFRRRKDLGLVRITTLEQPLKSFDFYIEKKPFQSILQWKRKFSGNCQIL